MILADKIIELRKKSGMTQDELAEKLGVSRQSVSKWEGAQSTPDLNRILKLSEIFSVSTDVLLRDELDLESSASPDSTPYISAPDETEPALRQVSMSEASEYLKANKRRSFLIALGIAVCVFSPMVIVFFDIFSLSDLGAVLMFGLIAAAVGLFIYSGSFMKKYEYLNVECIDTEYGVDGMVKEKREQDQPRNTLMLIAGVMMCILFFIPFIAADMFASFSNADDIGVILGFSILTAGVFLIVNSRCVVHGYDVLLEEGGQSREHKTKRKKTGIVMAIYWLVVTALYLGYSFITFDWVRSWIIWPVAGVLCPIVTLISEAVKKK